MFSQFSDLAFEIKITLASALGLSAILADISGDYKGWEDLSMKVVLLIAVVFIGKLYLQQGIDHKKEMVETWAEHKKEMAETWAEHKKDVETREEKMNQALQGNRDDMAVLIGLTKEQTDHYKSVTRKLIEDRIAKPNLP